MTQSPETSPYRTQRGAVLLVAAALLFGCVLIPVEESRFGSPTRLRFDARHTPYAQRDIIFSHRVHESLATCDTCHFGTVRGEEAEEGERPGAGGGGGAGAGAGGGAGAGADTDTETETETETDSESDAESESDADAVPAAKSGTGTDNNGPVALPAMALCFTCHDGEKATNQCFKCHLLNRKERKPGFHDGLWPQHHKRMADEEEYKCSLCHVESQCQGCHAERKPLSHTTRFERSTHGRMATHDRRSCATCHETAFCENCHSQPPPDHTPVFMQAGGHRQAALMRGRSCLVCHRFEDSCSCHQ
jgi:hypothetical protein